MPAKKVSAKPKKKSAKKEAKRRRRGQPLEDTTNRPCSGSADDRFSPSVDDSDNSDSDDSVPDATRAVWEASVSSLKRHLSPSFSFHSNLCFFSCLLKPRRPGTLSSLRS